MNKTRESLLQDTEKLFWRVAGLLHNPIQGTTLELPTMHCNNCAPPIRMAHDNVTTALMIYDEPNATQGADQLFGCERREFHREGTVIGTLSVLMISVGPSSGIGSPCLRRLER